MPMCPNCGISDPEVYLGFTEIECVNRECVSYHAVQGSAGTGLLYLVEKIIQYCEHNLTHKGANHPLISVQVWDEEIRIHIKADENEYSPPWGTYETAVDKDTLKRLQTEYKNRVGYDIDWHDIESCLYLFRIYETELQQQQAA